MSAEVKEVVPVQPATGMAGMMERLALNPDLPVDKLEKLLDMQIKIMAIEAEKEFAAAMARVQSKLPKVARDRKNDQTNSMYSTLEAIAAAIKPIYTAEGFSTTFSEGKSDKPDHVRVLGELMHSAGHKKSHYYADVAIDKTGIKGNDNKTLTHAEGSSFTYGRRYLTCLMFDVATGVDNDGNPPYERITEAQAADLAALIEEVKADKAKFLKWCQVEKIEEIPAKWYVACCNQLRGKKADGSPKR